MNTTRVAVGVDIGGTKTSVGLVSEYGLTAGSLLRAETPAREGPEAIVERVALLVDELDSGIERTTVVGVGSAGVVSAEGAILSATNSISDWQGFDLASALQRKLGHPVRVLNDVHAAALGEARCGAGRQLESFLMVTVGTGVGGAIYRNEVPWTGVSGTAGSVGHTAARNQPPRDCTCGQSGHIEAYASGPAIERSYHEATGVRVGLREIAALAQGEGDAAQRDQALGVISVGATILGVGLADAMNLEDLDAVIIGGGVASIGALYLTAVQEAFATAALPGPAKARVRGAELGPQATVVGAGLYALAERK